MALFKRRKGTTVVSSGGDATSVAPAASRAPSAPADRAGAGEHGSDRNILLEPYLTEKSSIRASHGQYTFLVRPDAEKVTIARAIAQRFHVHPTRVRIVRSPGKVVRYGKTVGQRSGIKKAIITLRTGETMPFGMKT